MIAIIDYRAGNLTSVRLAFEGLGIEARITNEPGVVHAAARVVFPGVGAAGTAMSNLERLGLKDVIHETAASGKPFLGICLGTQIILEHSDEDGGVDCLGIMAGNVMRFGPADRYDKVPQMGWNQVALRRTHPVLEGIGERDEFYFDHSYYTVPEKGECVLGTTDYGIDFPSVIGKGNLVAAQFHPEKSGAPGLRILENFSRWETR